MDILGKAMVILSKYPLCDHCLGRQFALLGYNIENKDRGKAIKLSLVLQASSLNLARNSEGVQNLKFLATNGFSVEAKETLRHLKIPFPSMQLSKKCFLCEDKFQSLNCLTQKALKSIEQYEHTTFLMGIELPTAIEEREDELKASFNICCGENIKHEFGRLLGKRIAEQTGKIVEYSKPDITIIVNPFANNFRAQISPLFIAGRYMKLVRDMPQSKWFCSSCHGKGCQKCKGTGKNYPESVEELISKPLLEAVEGMKTLFHASGREDIDALMLGNGRPFVVEISKPKKRFLDIKKLQASVNAHAKGKVKVVNFRFTSKDNIRQLKKAESAQKEYRIIIEFAQAISEENLLLLEKQLSGVFIKQQTPLRVLHRRADLVREKYIYEVKVKKLSLKKAEMRIRCQGGLYVKELASGDEGRTVPNVSDLLGNKAKPLKLDVLNVIMDE